MHTHSNITHTASKLTHKCCETQECVRSLHCSRDFNRRPELWSMHIRIEMHLKCILCFNTLPHMYASMQHALPMGITNDQICVCVYCLAGWQHGTGQWWRGRTISRGHGSLPFNEAAHCGGTRPKVTHKHATLYLTMSDVSVIATVSQVVFLLYNTCWAVCNFSWRLFLMSCAYEEITSVLHLKPPKLQNTCHHPSFPYIFIIVNELVN